MMRRPKMSEFLKFLGYLAIMAGVTYLIRMIPLVFFRKKIKNRFVRSFLHYIPYAVLTVMTFPAVFYSTSYMISAIIGTAVAVMLAFLNRSLIVVAAGASLAVLICELVLPLIA